MAKFVQDHACVAEGILASKDMGSRDIDSLSYLVWQDKTLAVPSKRWEPADEDGKFEWTRRPFRKVAQDQTGNNRSAFGEPQDSIKRISLGLLNVLLEKITRFQGRDVCHAVLSHASTETFGRCGLS